MIFNNIIICDIKYITWTVECTHESIDLCTYSHAIYKAWLVNLNHYLVLYNNFIIIHNIGMKTSRRIFGGEALIF